MKEESRKMKKEVEETEMRSAGMKRRETQIERERESDEQAKRERDNERRHKHTQKKTQKRTEQRKAGGCVVD